MIQVAADFPEVGSFALIHSRSMLAEAAELKAVRILALSGSGRTREADISILGIPSASGRCRVGLSDLIDGTPLSDAERAELQAMIDRPRTRSRKRARFEALQSRAEHAPVLAAQLDLRTRALVEARRHDELSAAGFRGRFGRLQANRAASVAAASVS